MKNTIVMVMVLGLALVIAGCGGSSSSSGNSSICAYMGKSVDVIQKLQTAMDASNPTEELRKLSVNYQALTVPPGAETLRRDVINTIVAAGAYKAVFSDTTAAALLNQMDIVTQDVKSVRSANKCP